MTQATPAGPAPREMGGATRLRAILGGSIGNLVEWFDWYAYAAFSLYFAKVFFPKGDQTAELLNAAAVFAVGFLARPFGGWMMGLIADRIGRRPALTLSMLLMGGGSLAIGLLPGYAQWGVLSPTLLVVARLVQGLSVGGEYASSATYLSEVAGQRHRGFWSSFQYVTLISGQLLALGVLILLQRTMSPEALEAWGWRIPFFIGFACALTALYIRRNIPETDSFKAARAARTEPVRHWRVLAQHPREVGIVLGLSGAGSLVFYSFTTYMQKFLVNTSGFSKDRASAISAGALIVFVLLQPLMGWFSDRVGRRPMLIGYGLIGAACTIPIFNALAGTRDASTAFWLITAALTFIAAYTSISAVVKAELFPAEIRALGVGLPYAVGNSIFGGTAEYVALWLKQAGHETWFYAYVAVFLAIAGLIAVFMREPQRHSRMLDDASG